MSKYSWQCAFCGSTEGDEAPPIDTILCELPCYEPAYFGDDDLEQCDNCGRVTCMACAVFDFTGERMRYLCPDCGQPEHVVMERHGAPRLLEV